MTSFVQFSSNLEVVRHVNFDFCEFGSFQLHFNFDFNEIYDSRSSSNRFELGIRSTEILLLAGLEYQMLRIYLWEMPCEATRVIKCHVGWI